jgi:hypothetical protein
MIRIDGEFCRNFFLVPIPTGPQGFSPLADNKSDGAVKIQINKI